MIISPINYSINKNYKSCATVSSQTADIKIEDKKSHELPSYNQVYKPLSFKGNAHHLSEKELIQKGYQYPKIKDGKIESLSSRVIINSADMLQTVFKYMNDNELKYHDFVLVNDISFLNKEFAPFYLNTTELDGNGYTISDIYLKKNDGAAPILYAYDSKIKNLNLKNINIVSEGSVGGLVGNAIDTLFENITIDANLFSTTKDRFVGGLIAYGTKPRIKNVETSGNYFSNAFIGGICGRSEDNVVIIDSKSNANLFGKNLIGGMIGFSDSDQIEDSKFTGNILAQNQAAGALGYSKNSHIKNFENKGFIKGKNYINPIIGEDAGFNTRINCSSKETINKTQGTNPYIVLKHPQIEEYIKPHDVDRLLFDELLKNESDDKKIIEYLNSPYYEDNMELLSILIEKKLYDSIKVYVEKGFAPKEEINKAVDFALIQKDKKAIKNLLLSPDIIVEDVKNPEKSLINKAKILGGNEIITLLNQYKFTDKAALALKEKKRISDFYKMLQEKSAAELLQMPEVLQDKENFEYILDKKDFSPNLKINDENKYSFAMFLLLTNNLDLLRDLIKENDIDFSYRYYREKTLTGLAEESSNVKAQKLFGLPIKPTDEFIDIYFDESSTQEDKEKCVNRPDFSVYNKFNDQTILDIVSRQEREDFMSLFLKRLDNIDANDSCIKSQKIKNEINYYNAEGKRKIQYNLLLKKIKIEENPNATNRLTSELIMLLNSGKYNFDWLDEYGNNLFHIASCTKSIYSKELMSLTLKNMVDINQKNSFGKTPLMSAISDYTKNFGTDTKRLTIANIKYLLEHGADINIQDNNGQSVVHQICKSQDTLLLNLIAAKNPDFEIKDKSGKMPKDYLNKQ